LSESSHTEYELVLMVRSLDPENILEKISELTSLSNYRLVRKETENLRDVYFDTPDHSLSGRRLNLRLRYLSGVAKITLKQSPGLLNDAKLNSTGLLLLCRTYFRKYLVEASDSRLKILVLAILRIL
jgi:hypothetical protein